MAPDDQLQPNNIPRDIIFDILLKLPIKFLCRFKSASKDWLALIKNVLKVRFPNEPQKLIFPSMPSASYYTLDSQSPNKFVEIKSFSNHYFQQIIGSCHGVLLLRCFSSESSRSVILYLWNPLTGKYKLIPSPEDNKKTLLIEGLGYDASEDEFKLVMALRYNNNNQTYVLSANNSSVSSCWNRVGYFAYNKYSNNQAAVLNGSPHWIVTRQRAADVIVYFDPHNETFGELPPCPVSDSDSTVCRLTILGKKLCWINHLRDYSYHFHIWSMKESSWSKLFVMPGGRQRFLLHAFMPPLCTITVDGKELDDNLRVHGGGEVVVYKLNSNALAFYDLKGKIYERRLKLPVDCNIYDAVYYVETPTSP